MSRLIVVSNRVNPMSDAGDSSQGGLAMALSAALRESEGIWFGWSGATTPEFTGQLTIERVEGVMVARLDLEQQDVDEYYYGFANKTLWPLFHYRIDLTEYDRSFNLGYERVNERFAQTLSHLIEPDDIIWVHDYHFFPLASALRRRGHKNQIGLFLHTPWPSRQLVATLPRHRALVRTLFDYDLIGFQAEDWLAAFRGYVENEIGGSVAHNVATAFNKSTLLGVFPIGLDTANVVGATESEIGRQSYQRMISSLAGRQMIIGVDRLDYSKGIEERFDGYERFLHENPEQREKVFLLQIATVSREAVEAYQDLRARLNAAAGRINGEFATFDWVPLRYVNTPYRRDELTGMYRAARAALVTPLRDGMNLVAKEYVASQDQDDPGVLILSRFAGAASQMKQALIINPFSREEIADAIKQALAMPLDERRARWRALMDGVTRDDVIAWSRDYVATLSGARPEGDTTSAAQ